MSEPSEIAVAMSSADVMILVIAIIIARSESGHKSVLVCVSPNREWLARHSGILAQCRNMWYLAFVSPLRGSRFANGGGTRFEIDRF